MYRRKKKHKLVPPLPFNSKKIKKIKIKAHLFPLNNE
jgi:hypothetical protein